MLKFTHRSFLVVITSFLLLTSTAFVIHAQQKPAGTPARRPTPTPTPQPTPPGGGRVFGGKSRISDQVKNSVGALIPSNSVTGTIRWKKDYGLVPSGPVTKTPSFWPCDPFFVAAMTNAGRPGSFGKLEFVAATHGQPSHGQPNEVVGEEGDYYVCRYLIAGLPTNKNLVIIAGLGGWLLLPELDPLPIYHTAPWIGGSQSQPPPGYSRVFTGGKSVTLTDSDSRAVVDFEMVYRPMPAPPR
jgi:hypothetical protein